MGQASQLLMRRVRLRHERDGMIVVWRRRILARQPVARANERDGAGDDGAQERQEDDGLVHTALNPLRIPDALQHKRSAVMQR